MKKLFNNVMGIAIAGLLFGGAALAQQTPPANTQQAPAPAKPATAPKSATGAQSSGAAKTGTAARPRRSATTAPAPLTTQKEKASYAIGMNIGKGLQKDGVDVDAATLARGLRDALTGAKQQLTDEEAQAALTALAVDVRAKQQAKFQALSAANKKEGDDFLTANKAKEGVTALPSGLQYKVLKEGTGPKPAATDKVVCNYRGTLISGTEFDSSYKRGEPATFPVNGVIKGWTEALQLMPVGSKWQLFLPPDLAYGERGAGQEIGPNSTLIFEVELLSIAPKADVKPDAQPETKPDTK